MTVSRKRIGLGCLVVPTLMGLGFMAGGTAAGLLGQSTMGYDQIANALGGAMAGSVIGLVVAVLLWQRFGARALVRVALVALVLIVGLLLVGRARRAARRAARDATARPSAVQLSLRAIDLKSSALAASLSWSMSTSTPLSWTITRSPAITESSVRSRPPSRLIVSTPL